METYTYIYLTDTSQYIEVMHSPTLLPSPQSPPCNPLPSIPSPQSPPLNPPSPSIPSPQSTPLPSIPSASPSIPSPPLNPSSPQSPPLPSIPPPLNPLPSIPSPPFNPPHSILLPYSLPSASLHPAHCHTRSTLLIAMTHSLVL